MKDPYFTVLQTSKKAKERAKNAQIVTWIQAFRMKLYDIPYEKYIEDQLRAVYESDIKGFYMWNARQDYEVPIKVVINFNNKKSNIAKN